MVGKIILWILLGLLALLAVILLIPAKVRFTYDRGDLELLLCFGPVKLKLFPRPEKPEEAPDENRKKKPKKPKKEKEQNEQQEKGEKDKPKITREQILYALETLPPILLRALKRTGRRIRIQPFKVYLLVAGPDPADTALLYGKLEGALGALLPALDQTVKTREEDIRLFLDFTEPGMDCIADVGAALRPWDLVSVGVRAAGSLLKWYLGFRKLGPPKTKKDKPVDDEKHKAA